MRIINDPFEVPKHELKKTCDDDYSMNGSSSDNQSELPFITDEAIDLLQKLLDKNPKTRITLSDALDHPWFLMTNDRIIN